MNDKFFHLPVEKQQSIINAAYRIFSKTDYKKAPMSEISDECGISKALLFYYFKNKKELYIYLCQYAMELTANSMKEFRVADTSDFFEMMKRNIQAKCSLIQCFPYICAFSLKAYYEQNLDIKKQIQSYILGVNYIHEQNYFHIIDYSAFRSDIDFNIMYKNIFLTCEGYLYRSYQSGKIDAAEIEKDFMTLIEHWKKIYLRKDTESTTHDLKVMGL